VGELLSTIQDALQGSFVIEAEIGRGGTATVFRARDVPAERQVAVKVLRPEFTLTLMAERFHREIALLNRLEHRNILPVLHSGESQGLFYFTMPLTGGETLRSRIDESGALPLEDSLSLIRDVAAAIDHAHEHNVLHRDITPSNVMLEEGRAIVCDFGIARAIEVAVGEELSSSGLVIGTPEYMSPEQASGDPELTGAVDIYALGCLTYTMLTGEAPFSGPTTQAILARHVAEHPRSIRIVRPEVPERWQRTVEWALSKDPEKRPVSGAEFVQEFEAPN
jgi:serine/threonine-protein kinase